MTQTQDSGLVKRGLALLALMTALVLVLLSILFQRTAPTLPAASNHPELQVAALVRSEAGFPAAISWAALFQSADALPSSPGWEVRYNAARTWALLGLADVPWNIFLEMLDEHRQMRNFRAELHDGKIVPDEARARETVLIALKAIAEWHRKQTPKNQEVPPDLAKVYAAVANLADSPFISLKTEAAKTRQTFFR